MLYSLLISKMKQFLILLSFLILFTQNLRAQSKFSISGYVKDTANGEALVNCNVSVEGSKSGTNTNNYGFYSISLPEGNYNLIFQFVGYSSKSVLVNVTKNITQNIELYKSAVEIAGVSISKKRKDNAIEKVEMSSNSLNISQIKKIPALLGEVDIVKSIQLLPGVSSVGEGATGFNVRGGAIDQNLILMDEAPVFNSSHLFGFFSVFNPDAVKDVKLLKGGIPAEYGGRLSSILDVRLKDGNIKNYEVNGGVGLIFSRLSIEGPIKLKKDQKAKTSFIVAGRRSYIDVLAKPFLRNNENLQNATFYFYDFTGKINHTINSKNKIFFSTYVGRDAFGTPGAKFDWGNRTATFRWNHLFSSKLFSNFTFYYSKYDYKLGFGSGASTFDWQSNIQNYSGKVDFNYYQTPKSLIQFGAISTYYNFQPGKAVSADQGRTVEFGLPNKYALENGFYVDNERKVSSRLTVKVGFRWSNFNYLGKGKAFIIDRNQNAQQSVVVGEKDFKQNEIIQSYNVPEPRFSMNYKLNTLSSVKLGYNRMSQFLHLISNTAASVPLDVWTPSTNNIKPQIADQIAIGYFRNFGKNIDYEFTAEVFYKTMQNQIDYIDGANLLLNDRLEADLLNGKGRAYGLELYFKKNVGKLTGWISYTLSKSDRQVNGINNNEWYANRFDRRHNANATVSYSLNKKWDLSASFVVGSGTPTNLPNTKFTFQGISSIPHNATGRRNDVFIKPFHRLDLSGTYTHKKTKKWESSWVFGVYNVYNRRNPFSYFAQPNPDNNNQTQLIRFSIIGSVIPSVSWNFKF